jgi:soluble lytic murein transglycosylase-like protein
MKKLTITLIILLSLIGCTQQQEPIKQTVNFQELVDIETTEPFIPIYDIPISEKLQEYTYELCDQYNLSYELVLAVIHTESSFIETANSGLCKGLMQISRSTGDWISEQIGIENFNPYNPEQNIAVGVWYLDYLRNYWLEQGADDETAFVLMLMSYNMGPTACRSYVKKYGLKNSYVQKVFDFKYELEKTG